MLLNNVMVILGSLLMGLAQVAKCFELLIAGRLILGLSNGAVMTIMPIWVNEVSPAQFRGPLSCLQHTFLNLGCAAGAFLGLKHTLGTEQTWGYLLGMPLFAGIIQIVLYPLFPETPKFLLIHKCDEEAACKSIHFYHGSKANARRVILHEIKKESFDALQQKGLLVALQDSDLRSGVLLGALTNLVNVFTGVMAIVSYSTVILCMNGLSESTAQYVTAFGTVLFAVISLPAVYLVEKVGRRPLLMSSLVLITVCDFGFVVFGLLGAKTVSHWASYMFMFTILLFIIGYNLGVGPISHFISAELAHPSVRMVSLAVGVAVGWLSTAISVFIFYPIESAAGFSSFLLFGIPTLIITVILYWKLPETKIFTSTFQDVELHVASISSWPAAHSSSTSCHQSFPKIDSSASLLSRASSNLELLPNTKMTPMGGIKF